MPHWFPHAKCNLEPPSDRCKALRRLHLTQVVDAAADAEAGDPGLSILCNGMGKVDRSRELRWSPVAWLSCLSTQDRLMAFTVGEWQSWFC